MRAETERVYAAPSHGALVAAAAAAPAPTPANSDSLLVELATVAAHGVAERKDELLRSWQKRKVTSKALMTQLRSHNPKDVPGLVPLTPIEASLLREHICPGTCAGVPDLSVRDLTYAVAGVAQSRAWRRPATKTSCSTCCWKAR